MSDPVERTKVLSSHIIPDTSLNTTMETSPAGKTQCSSFDLPPVLLVYMADMIFNNFFPRVAGVSRKSPDDIVISVSVRTAVGKAKRGSFKAINS